MALSRSAARTARQKRWLWALTACGGAAGLMAVEVQFQQLAQEHGQTTTECVQEQVREAAISLKKTTRVANALLQTAVSSAKVAVQRRSFDAGDLRADLAATLADLALDTPIRRHMVALGGSYFLDWLLHLAYPQVPPGNSAIGSSGSSHGTSGSDIPNDGANTRGMSFSLGGSLTSADGLMDSQDFGTDVVLRPGPAPLGGVGAGPPWGCFGAESRVGLDEVEKEDEAPGTVASLAAAERLCREAERALESFLLDGMAAGLLLDRPGAVPLLLRAVAEGRASQVVSEALAARASEARSAPEAMTADLREAVEVLRGCGGGGGGVLAGGGLQLQCTAAGLLTSAAAGSIANRSKLTGLGLQGVVAEVTTAVSGLSDPAAIGLQWHLLRLARVMAEHSSSSDSHHLAAVVLPLLYTAADAAAAEDASMASYAVDTLTAAVRYGGAPVADVVSNSTMPHLLWQLAESLGAHRVAPPTPLPPTPADGRAVHSAAAEGSGQNNEQLTMSAAATVVAKAKSARSWFWSRKGGSVVSTRDTSTGAAPPAGASAAPEDTSAAAAAPNAVVSKSLIVMRVKDPAVVASVASAVVELARSALLPEAQVPRWRDWLLDVLCVDGFDPGTSGAAELLSSSSSGSPAHVSLPGHKLERTDTPLLPRRDAAGANSIGSSSSGSGAAPGASSSSRRSSINNSPSLLKQQHLPSWLTLPEAASLLRTKGGCNSSGSVSSNSRTGGTASAAVESGRGIVSLEAMETVRSGVVAALSALSHVSGNHGLQVAHYWLSRLLSELAARTLPYTSLVYLEGPRAPQDLIHAVPVLPSYVKSVAEALKRAADAAADDCPPLPPHLEFELAGSGLVGPPPPPPPTQKKPRSRAPGSAHESGAPDGGKSPAPSALGGRGAGLVAGTGVQQQEKEQQPQGRVVVQQQAEVAAYLQAAHVVDQVLAERKAADALEALCAIVAPDAEKQRWLLHRGVLPLLHRFVRTADDLRVSPQEPEQTVGERLNFPPLALMAAASTSSREQGNQVLQLHPSSRVYHTSQQRAQQPQWNLSLPQQHHFPPQQQQQIQVESAEVSELLSDHEGGPSLCLQRQVARVLALLALLPDAREGFGGLGGCGSGCVEKELTTRAAAGAEVGAAASSREGWLRWLRHAASHSDCRLSSNATRALLHLAVLDVKAAAAAVEASAATVRGERCSGPGMTDAVVTAPPVFLDGIHLLDPGAQHHWALVQQSAASVSDTTLASATADAEVAAVALQPGTTCSHGPDDGPRTHGTVGLLAVHYTAPWGRSAAEATTVLGSVGVVSEPSAPSTAELGLTAISPTPPEASDDGGSASSASVVTSTASYIATVTVLFSSLRHLVSWPLSVWFPTTALASTPDFAPTPLGPGAHPHPPPLQFLTAAAASAAEVTSDGAMTPQPGASLQSPAGTASMSMACANGFGATGTPLKPSSSTKAKTGAASTTGSLVPTPSSSSPLPPPLPPPPPPPAYPAPYTDIDTADGYTSTGGGGSGCDGGGDIGMMSAGPPVVDVVFVHGIRGGPFITWRKAGVMTRGSAASHMERSACWPSTWLAEDLPGARLLSVEYLAPVSAWEGESLPLEDNVIRVMGQLAAAGVGTGQRPVVFVAHSMGGLLVKEMLARSMDQVEAGGPHAALAASTLGIAFFGTPHFGNALAALGWRLRHVPGALPAPSLARLTPGPHLLSLNDRLRELHDAQGSSLRVVSLMEGQPTQLSGVIPRIVIVAPDSAYPGFGATMTLPENDHIDCCKPAGRTAPAYSVVRDLVLHAVRVAAPGGG